MTQKACAKSPFGGIPTKMKKPDTTIEYIEPGSFAEEAGLKKGDVLLSVNGSDFHDVLEYRYLTSEAEVELAVLKTDASVELVVIENDFEDIGIGFKSDLIDEAKSCRNQCIFCFIDQLPKGMRPSVYFKDDDTRLSFLQGNYVTLTNLAEEEIERMIKMRISPINLSVHTTNPALRRQMLHNKNAGKLYDTMKRFAKEKLTMNCQVVLCRDYNDKVELDRTIQDLAALYPYVASLSVVPVGLTAYREGLCELEPYTPEVAYEVVKQIETWQEKILKKHGSRMVYAADEFYLTAGLPLPNPEAYEGFPQLENGVGLIASMEEEFDEAIRLIKPKERSRRIAIATGELAYLFIQSLADKISKHCPGVEVLVYPIKNRFFGGGVTVAGLVCGMDLMEQMQDMPKADVLLIPSVMLRDGEDIFLDDTPLEQVQNQLQMPIIPINNDGYEFVEAVLGEELF